MGELFLLVFVLIGIFIYLFPTVTAIYLEQSNVASIAVINIFLGWTLVGWVVALAWAFKKE